MTAENDAKAPKKPSKKAGRHALTPGEPMTTMISSKVSKTTKEKIMVLGQDSVSDGLRVAVDYAYDQYQRGRLILESKT